MSRSCRLECNTWWAERQEYYLKFNDHIDYSHQFLSSPVSSWDFHHYQYQERLQWTLWSPPQCLSSQSWLRLKRSRISRTRVERAGTVIAGTSLSSKIHQLMLSSRICCCLVFVLSAGDWLNGVCWPLQNHPTNQYWDFLNYHLLKIAKMTQFTVTYHNHEPDTSKQSI